MQDCIRIPACAASCAGRGLARGSGTTEWTPHAGVGQSEGQHGGGCGRSGTDDRADQRSVHPTLDGHLVRTAASRPSARDLRWLTLRGARPAGPPPASPALPHTQGALAVPAGQAVEIDRVVHRDGLVDVGGTTFQVGTALSGQMITLRLDGHLMHAIADDVLAAPGSVRSAPIACRRCGASAPPRPHCPR